MLQCGGDRKGCSEEITRKSYVFVGYLVHRTVYKPLQKANSEFSEDIKSMP